MNEDKTTKEFTVKFSKLTEHNQKYIIAIQQALMFAQTGTIEAEKRLDAEKAVSLNHVS